MSELRKTLNLKVATPLYEKIKAKGKNENRTAANTAETILINFFKEKEE